MAPLTPYTYFQCPCSDGWATLGRKGDGSPSSGDRDDDDEERTFDPRAARANFSLYTLDYLLYCEDCHQIRCPRCVAEEIITYFCPNCLFEVPSSNIKSEGNRCATPSGLTSPPPPRTSLNLADSSPHCATIDVHAVASNVPSALDLSPLRASRASPTPTYLRRQRARVRRTRAPISSPARIATGARQRSASSLKSLTAFTRNSQSYATVERPG